MQVTRNLRVPYTREQHIYREKIQRADGLRPLKHATPPGIKKSSEIAYEIEHINPDQPTFFREFQAANTPHCLQATFARFQF